MSSPVTLAEVGQERRAALGFSLAALGFSLAALAEIGPGLRPIRWYSPPALAGIGQGLGVTWGCSPVAPAELGVLLRPLFSQAHPAF